MPARPSGARARNNHDLPQRAPIEAHPPRRGLHHRPIPPTQPIYPEPRGKASNGDTCCAIACAERQ
eukprot:11517655-Alexandrium_andersonii.AAC.1